MCSGIPEQALLPIPASGVRHAHAALGLKIMAVVVELLGLLQVQGVPLPKEINWAKALALIPSHLRSMAKVGAQEPPELFAEDHVLKIGDFAQYRLAERMVDGAEHKRVSGLAVDDALEDMVILDANSQDHILAGQCPRNPFGQCPSSVLRRLGSGPTPSPCKPAARRMGRALQS